MSDDSKKADLADCARCGALIDPESAAVSSDGLICLPCETRENAPSASWGAASGMTPLKWGLLSLVCNPFFLFSLFAISGGVSALQTAARMQRMGERDPRQLGDKTEAWMAIMFGSITPVFGLAGLGLAFIVFVIVGLEDPAYDDDFTYYDDPAWEADEYRDDYDEERDLDQLGDPRYDPLPTFEPPARSVVYLGHNGEGQSCTVRVFTLSASSLYNCRIEVTCQGEVIYGADGSGYNTCEASGDEMTSARDVGRTGVDGDPALRFDLPGRTVRVTDPGLDVTVTLDR